MAYCLGRLWIEHLRIDTIELNDVLGLRWGEWMAIGLFTAALAYFVAAGRRHPAPESREASVYVDRAVPAVGDQVDGAGSRVGRLGQRSRIGLSGHDPRSVSTY